MAKYKWMERVYEVRGIEFCSMQGTFPCYCLLPHDRGLGRSTEKPRRSWCRDLRDVLLEDIQGPVMLKESFPAHSETRMTHSCDKHRH